MFAYLSDRDSFTTSQELFSNFQHTPIINCSSNLKIKYQINTTSINILLHNLTNLIILIGMVNLVKLETLQRVRRKIRVGLNA
jgi:hypothetical protein